MLKSGSVVHARVAICLPTCRNHPPGIKEDQGIPRKRLTNKDNVKVNDMVLVYHSRVARDKYKKAALARVDQVSVGRDGVRCIVQVSYFKAGSCTRVGKARTLTRGVETFSMLNRAG